MRRVQPDATLATSTSALVQPGEVGESGFPYPTWDLGEIVSTHGTRFRQLLVHKAGFASPESADAFMEVIREIAQRPISAEDKMRDLQQQYQALPDALTFRQRETQWNERHADQMLQTLRAATADGTLVFPGGAQTPATFVDIGCADGRKTGALARAFSLPPESAIGLDIVKANKVAENIKFMEMLPNVLPDAIKPDSQDLAAISMVLHHSDDPGALLRSVHTALKPGGFVVIREHNAGDSTLHGYLNTVHILYDNVFQGLNLPMPNIQNYKGLDDWKAIFKGAGFEILKTDYVTFSPDSSDENAQNTTENFTCVLRKPQQ